MTDKGEMDWLLLRGFFVSSAFLYNMEVPPEKHGILPKTRKICYSSVFPY